MDRLPSARALDSAAAPGRSPLSRTASVQSRNAPARSPSPKDALPRVRASSARKQSSMAGAFARTSFATAAANASALCVASGLSAAISQLGCFYEMLALLVAVL